MAKLRKICAILAYTLATAMLVTASVPLAGTAGTYGANSGENIHNVCIRACRVMHRQAAAALL